MKGLSDYERWALKFFHNKKFTLDPYVNLTLQLDITDAEKRHEESCHNVAGASLTAYLHWHLIQAMKGHPCFFWRLINNKWYQFKNLPLSFLVIVGEKERYNELLIGDVCSMDWPSFCKAYRCKVDEAQSGRTGFTPLPYDLWRLTIFIGNQPDLQFTALSPHRQQDTSGRPVFYFGRRYRDGDKLFTPLLISFDHSTLDPYVIAEFLKDYQRSLIG
jgi:chloramphenicol O-acetyltransferase